MLVTIFSLLLSILTQNYVNYSMLPRVSTTFRSFNELKITKMIICMRFFSGFCSYCMYKNVSRLDLTIAKEIHALIHNMVDPQPSSKTLK